MRTTPSFLIALVLALVSCGTDTSPPADIEAPAATAAPATEPTEPVGTAAEHRSFTFAEGSEVRFVITEELRGDPKTVVGTNTEVSGEFLIDEVELGLMDDAVVTVAAAEFVTNEDKRNGAIDRFILDVTAHPEITFSIESISSAGQVGGTLTIRGIAHAVVFDVAASQTADSITLSGSAMVNRTDWDLNIPSVPFVANVSEEVTLEFDFILEPVG